jgi:integrase
MASMKTIRLTDESVAALPFASGTSGVYVVRDSETTGFRCIINRNSKRLVYQGELREAGKRRTVYKRLGDPEHVKVAEARARALEEMARLTRLTDPDAKAGTTFGQAWDDPIEGYKAGLAKHERSDRTITDYQQKFTAHLEPTFGKVALRDITRSDVVRLHKRLTDEGHPYAANSTCRVGHAIYRHAALGLEVPGLNPLNPFRAYKLFNKEEARQTGMSERDLSGWFGKVVAMDNPVMRELWVMTMLTGLRRNDLCTMQWANVNLDESYVEIPSPKGGEARAFRCPLTPPMIKSLERVRRAGKSQCDTEQCKPWIFPSTASKTGHIVEPKNKTLGTSPHALRHSFRGFCEGAKVSTVHSKLLMNHKISKEVHDSYMTMGAMFDQLREASESVSTYILKHLPKGAERDLERRLREQLKPRQ